MLLSADGQQWRWPVVAGAALAAPVIWVGANTAGSNVVSALPIGLAAAVIGSYLIWQSIARRPWALITLLIITLLVLNISFRDHEIDNVGLNWQNGLKLLVWAVLLGSCSINIRRLIRFAADPVMLAFTCYILICILSTLWSPARLLTFTAAMSITAYMGFACLLVGEFSERQLYRYAVSILAVYCLLNVLSAVLLPDIAFFRVDPTTTETRFMGISGHPNSLGGIAATFGALALGAAYRRYFGRTTSIAFMLLALGLTLATESRTALGSLVLAAFLQMRRRYILLVCGALAVLVAAIIIPDQVQPLLAAVGRDGDASEATSMSGRTDLWQFAWGLIVQQPLIGYGFNSFEALSGVLWTGPADATVATHNNYLSVLYCTGLFGSIPFATGFGILLYRWLLEPDVPRDLVVFNGIILGFGESDIMSTINVMPTLMFLMVVAIDARKRHAALFDDQPILLQAQASL